MRTLKIVALAALMMAAASSANAVELYGQASTEGVGVGIGTGLNDLFTSAPSSIGLRAEVNGFPTFHKDFSAGNINYNARAQLRSVDGYVDFFPIASSSFRLTGGFLVNDDKVEGDGTYKQGSISFGGQRYDLTGQSVHGQARYPAVMPYFGLGFGHKTTSKGFGVFGDIGVAYGRPDVDLSYNGVTGSTVAALPTAVQNQANSELASERNDLQSKANKARFYPIVKLGVNYRF